jgi:hypothetical protein
MGVGMDVHPDNVDLDNLTFFQLESIVEQYRYSPSDLIYFRDLEKNLVEGLDLVSSNYDVSYMACKHVETPIVELYIVSFQDDGGGDGEDDEEEDVGGRVDLNDPWWDDKISDDNDCF